MTNDRAWIPPLEIEDLQVKWAWSNFGGVQKGYDAEGDHNFQAIIPEEEVDRLRELGWTIREQDPQEEGDPPEYLMKVIISTKNFPTIYFIRAGRKFRIEDPRELKNITRNAVERMDVIIGPSRWTSPDGKRSGISAYVNELYVNMLPNRIAERYMDYEEA